MSTEHPVVARYMAQFEAALQKHNLPEWREIATDVRSHIDEAQQFGKPIDDVITALGPADALARAYAVELTMNPPKAKSNWFVRALKVIWILAASSFVTFVVVSILGSIAFAFTLSGIAVIVLTALEAAGFHQENLQLAGIHPLAAMFLIGPPIVLLGLGAGWLLWKYMRVLTRTLTRALPRAVAA